MKQEDRSERGRKRSFVKWMLFGLALFAFITGSYTMLAKQYICNIDMERVSAQPEQAALSDGVLCVKSNEAQIYFDLEKDVYINYIAISVKKRNGAAVNGKLYYSDSKDDFHETKAVSFYMKEGLNEIKTSIGKKKYFRLDILGGV